MLYKVLLSETQEVLVVQHSYVFWNKERKKVLSKVICDNFHASSYIYLAANPNFHFSCNTVNMDEVRHFSRLIT